MSKKKDEKTNVMRLLEQAKIPYAAYAFESSDMISAPQMAEKIGQNPARLFKTLVTHAASGAYCVFVIPSSAELDLKKAAHAVGEKSVEMLKQKNLLPLTGYIHGGCSPLGMKKLFTTVLDQSAQNFDSIIFSAGKIGHMVDVSPNDIAAILPFAFADIVK